MEKETLFCSLSLLSYFDYDTTDVSVEVMLEEIVNDQQLRLDYAATVSYTHLDVYKRQGQYQGNTRGKDGFCRT